MLKRNTLVTLLALFMSLTTAQFASSAPGDILSSFTINNSTGDGRTPTRPQGITYHNGFLWITDFGTDRIYRVYPQNVYDTDGTTLLFSAGESTLNIPLPDTVTDAEIATAEAGSPIVRGGVNIWPCRTTPEIQFCGGGGLTFAKNFLWNATPIMDRIVKIDPVDGGHLEDESALQALTFPAPSDITYDGTHFWIVDWAQNTVTRAHPEDAADITVLNLPPYIVDSSIPDPAPYGVTWDGQALWIAEREEQLIYRIGTDGTLLDYFAAPGTGIHGLGWDGETLWAADQTTGTIFRLDSGITPIGVTGCVMKNNTGLRSAVVLEQTAVPDQPATTDADGCFHFPTFRAGVPMRVTLSETGINEKPFIQLTAQNGSVDVYIEVGGTYAEPGFIATDEEDGDITADVTASPNVLNNPTLIQTNVINMTGQPITYSVFDSTGNHADPQTRMVYVTPIAYTIAGSVSGLASGQSVTLANNGSDTLTVSANDTFTFGAEVPENQPYNVTVATQPTGQTCSVANGSGTATADFSNVQVTCVDITYNIFVSSTGLSAGDSLVVSNNASSATITANGTQLLANVVYNSAYNIQIVTPPANKTCNFGADSTTSGNALSDMTVTVQCQFITYTLGGTLTGLEAGDTPALRLESNALLTTLSANGAFTLTGTINSGSAYLVQINQSPTNKNCTITNNSGTATANVTTINIDCLDNIPPAVPTVNTLTTNNPRPVISGGANPVVGDVLSISLNGATYDSVPVSSGTWSVNTATATPSSGTFSPLSGGIYDIAAIMVDGAGNSSSDLTSNELTIDLVLPAVPTVNSIITNATIPGPVTGSATLSAGETLRVVVNGATYNNVAVSAGSWSINLATDTPSSGALGAFVNGTSYNVVATVSDTAGNSVSDATTNEVVIDRTPPAAPATPDMTAATDTGTSDTDNNTANTRPDFSGICTASERITLFINAVNTGVSQVCSTGSYTLSTPNVLSNGTHAITVTATDLAGNQSPASVAALSVTIDTVAPVAPTIATLITNNNRPTLTGTATINAGESLEISINAVVYSNVPVTAGTWSLNTATATPTSGTFNPLANGSYNISAVSVDLAGNVASDSTTNELTIDTVAPVVPTVNIITTNDTTPNISGSATLVSGETLRVTVNGATYSNVPTNTGIWSINTDLVTPSSGTLGVFVNGNSYEVVAVVTDAAGNSSTDTSANEITIDTTPPTTPTVNTLVTNDLTPTISGTATVGAGETLSVTFNGATYNNVASPAGVWNIDTGAVTPTSGTLGAFVNGNSYNVVATVTDTARLTTTDVTSNEITIDLTPPSAPAAPDLTPAADLGRLDTDNITNDTTPTVTGTCTNNETIRLYVDTAATGVSTVCSAGNYTLTIATALAIGVRNLSVTTTDIAGNESAQSSALAVTIDTTAPVAPGVPDLTPVTDTGSSNTDNITGSFNPEFTGTCINGETITLFVDGANSGSSQVCAASIYTITLTSSLSNGSYLISARATDLAGNDGVLSSTLNIIIDTTASAPPAVPNLADASDTGVSSTDNITSDTTPTLNGACVSGDTIRLFVDGTASGDVATCAAGNYSITPSVALSNGSYQLTATATGTTGVPSPQSSALVVVIDTVAPAAPGTTDLTVGSDTGRSGTDNITAADQPVLAGLCAANESMTLFIDGAASGAAMACASGNYSLTTLSPLLSGNRVFTVTATDLAGNQSTQSAALNVQIDTIAPTTLSVAALNAANDSGTSNSDRITNVTTLQFTGACTGNDSVALFINSIDTGAAILCSTGTYALTTPTVLSNGVYNVSVNATDAAGNTGALSTALAVTVDTTAPATPVVNNVLTGDTTPVLNGSATLAAGEILSISINGSTYAGVTVTAGAWTLDTGSATVTSGTAFSPLADGTYNVTALVVDLAGNSITDASTNELTIDTTAPTPPAAPDLTAASDTGSASTDNVTRNTLPTFSGSCTSGEQMRLYVNAVSTAASALCTASTYSVTAASALANGNQSITVTSTDTSGNESGQSAVLSVIIDTTPPLVPTVTTQTTNDVTPIISGSASLSTGDALSVSVNGASYNNVLVTAGSWSLNLETATPSSGTLGIFVDATYSVVALVTDIAGNTATDTSNNELVINTTAPLGLAAPDLASLSDSGSNNADNLTNVQILTLTGTCNNGETVRVYVDGSANNSSLCSGSMYSVTTTALSAGTRAITVTTTDTIGNESAQSAPLAIIIDLTAPTTPAATDMANASDSGASATDNVTNVTTPTFNGVCSNGDSLTLWVDGAATAVIQACSAGTYSLAAASALTNGAHSIAVSVTDAAGNTSAPSSGLNITIDTAPPAQPSAPDLTTASDTGVSNTDNITTVASPSFTGTCAAGETASLLINGTASAASVACNAGNYLLTAPTPLIDGNYSFTVRLADNAGNLSAASPALAVTIDNAMPSTPTVTAVTTNDTTPAVSGTAILVAGDVFSVTVNGATYSGVPVTAGNWAVDTDTATPSSGSLGVFIDGVYSVVAGISDAAGNNVSDITTNELTIDTTPPPVLAAPDLSAATDSGTSSTDNLTRITTPGFTGSCLNGNSVRLFVDDVANGSAVACAASVYNVSASVALTEGVRAITVTTSDPAGNQSAASAALNITIDTTAPAALSSAPDMDNGADSGTSATDNITNVALPAFSGACTDGEVISLYVDGSNSSVSTVCSANSYTLTAVSALSNGAHNVAVARTDAAGNDSTLSPALAITIDTSAPAAPAITDMASASDSGSSATDNITSTTQPTFSGACTSGETIRLFVDGVNSGVSATCSASAYALTPPSPLSNGNHTLSVTTTDLAGNTSVQSAVLNVVIDTVATALAAPDLTLVSDTGSSGTDNNTNDTTPTFAGTCSNGDSIALLVNGTANGAPATCSSASYNITASALTGGTYSITAINTDLAGNISAASPALSITLDTVAPAAPAINTVIAHTATPVLTGTATVVAGDILSVTVNGATYGNVAVTGGNWSLSLGTTSPTSGSLGSFTDNTSYNVVAILSDAAGNSQSDATSNELTVDTLTALTLSVTGYSSGTALVINTDSGTRSFTTNSTSVVNVTYGGAYSFSIATQPTGQVCTFPASTATPRTSISGTAGSDLTVSVVCVSTNRTYTNSTPVSIPTGGSSLITRTSTLTIPDNVQISDLNLNVNLSHTWMGDVSIRLTSPTGTTRLLMERPGATSAYTTILNFTHAGCSYNNMSATLDDEGSSAVESACVNATTAITGTRRPNNTLSVFDGEATAGVWTLTVYDSHPSADAGTLNSWSLNVTTSGL